MRIDALLVIDDEILYGQHDVLLSGDFSWSQYFKKEERELLCAAGGHILSRRCSKTSNLSRKSKSISKQIKSVPL